jgi:hypothetical protein
MPTVITGGQILPQGYAKNSWYNDLGAIGGHTADLILRAYLASQGGAGAFQKKDIPNPGYGQMGSPGATFSQPQPLPGTTSGIGMTPRQSPQQIKPQVAPRPASPFANQPMINQNQLEQLARLQAYQRQNDPAMLDLERREAEAKIRNYDMLSNLYKYAGVNDGSAQPIPTPSQPVQPQNIQQGMDLPDEVFQGSQTMKQLYQAAKSGDAMSARKIRLLAIEKNDPVAQALLEAMGEL